MEWRSFLVYVVATAVLVDLSQAVVWGPRQGGVSGRGEIQPTVMEIPDASEKSLSEAAERTVNRLRERRDTEDDDEVGYTARLAGDHHTFALVHWTGYPSEALFILTRKRTPISGFSLSGESWLWRSLDYGHTFKNDTVKWDNDTVVEWYYISPFSEYLIFADRIHHRLYVTKDEGDTYNRSDIPFRPDSLRFQSRYAQNSSKDPYNKYVLGYDGQNRSLWVSLDLGMNWTWISDNVVANRYYWRRMPNIDGLGTVYFEKNISDTESQLYCVRNVSDPRAELFDHTLGNFIKNTFVLELEYMFVQKNSTGGDQVYSSPLWVSHQRQPFNQARFPLQTQERHYAVVDASEGQVFIAVYHDINNTHLYLSEVEGLNYSLSLLYIISPPETQWESGYPTFDVHVVEGIVGTYIANQKVPGSRFGASVISYDKGGEWRYLIPPALDSSNSPIICALPECSLHLHMESDVYLGYQSILSQDSAVGLLMALGNLGSSLTSSSRDVRLYFSRDGGFTWFEVATGSWEFQFAAIGSVIVMVRNRVPTNSILWSCDEGHSWNETIFSNNANRVNVIGMLTEREEKARHVTIFGYHYGPNEWLIIDLNFTSVVSDLCAKEDYFLWVPTDDRPGSRCLLGEVITYERRQSSFCCYINPEYERPVNRTPCNCTIEDFECDFGFERINLNSPCSPLSWLQWPPPPPTDCKEGTAYNISSGYRKVAGDKCVPGAERYFFALERQCPVLPPDKLHITYDPKFLHPNINVSFSLIQNEGWKISTLYHWDFNDTSVPVNVTGFALGANQIHNFTMPGQYAVSVTARNDAGSSMAITRVTVYDIVTAVDIKPPVQAAANASAPTGIDLVFKASITTQYNTDVVGDASYVWNFGDGSGPTTTTSVITSHTFLFPNTYSITLKIIAPYSSAEKTTYQLHIYESAKHVQIVSDGLKQKQWVEVGEMLIFRVEKVPSYHEDIPPDTFYTWHLVPANGLPPVEMMRREFNYTFLLEGDYALSVVGNHSAGSFSTQIRLNAERYIGRVDIDATPTVRVGSQVVATVNPKQNGGQLYVGHLLYHVVGENGENFTDVVTANSDGSLIIKFSPYPNTITKSKDIAVIFNFWNHISNSTVRKSIGVVVFGDYGSVALKFPVSDLPTNYNTSEWLEKLRTGIVKALQLYHVRSSQIEIESTMHIFQDADLPVTTAKPASLPQQRSHNNILKRSEPKQVFVVNVNILPTSASQTNIQTAQNISQQLVGKGALTISVDGEQYKVEVQQRIQILIEPAQTVTVTNWQLYSGIGGGLGVVLILGVGVSVVLGLIIYLYRRRYNRLQIRYSRLSQAPVRFTFTQSGDMVEEDDPDFEPQDTTCAETDDQFKP